MRQLYPTAIRTLALTGLAAAISCISLPALSGQGHDHPAPPAAAVSTEIRQQATDHTQALMALQKRWAYAKGSEKSRALEQLVAKAEARQQLLAELIKTHPAEVLRVAIPEQQQLGMPEEVTELLEQTLELEGELAVVYEDYEDGTHKLRHFLHTPFDERLELHFAHKASTLPSGSRVRATGLLVPAGKDTDAGLDALMALESGDSNILTLAAGGSDTGSGPTTQAALPNTVGEQKTLVMLVNFQDAPSNKPWTTTQINSTLFGEVNSFYQENSAGQSWLSGTTVGWYTLPQSSTTCDYWGMSTAAQNAASAAGVNLANYSRYVYVFPKNACGWGGLGTVGGSKTHSWINGVPTLKYFAHELGHNFGLYHSRALDCSDGVLAGSCSSLSYGDSLDVMGNANSAHFNAFQKDRLGWFNGGSAASIQTITNSGSYQLGNYEFPTAASPTALKVLKSTDPTSGQKTWYYVELRQARGFDSFLSSNSNVLNGLVIHTGEEGVGDSSYLLDMTPNSSVWADFNDPALPRGSSFSDNTAGITLTTQWADASGGTLDVNLAQQSCIKRAPSINLTNSQSAWVAPGTAVSYSATLVNNDSADCAAASFALSTNKPSGWNTSLSQNSLTLAPGASAPVTLTVNSPLTATDGFYNINLNAANAGLSTSTTAVYVVSAPVSNRAPIANNDSATTDANTAVTINVLGNDSDPDGDALSVSSVSGGNGSSQINSNGTITFTPTNGFSGSTSFSYTINDGRGGSASATVTVTVNAPAANLPPVAADDAASTLESTPITIAVLVNDRDPEGQPLSLAAVSQASNGSLQANANGTVTYIPDKRFKGTDSFTYQVSDGVHTAQASVSVTVDKATGNTDSTDTGSNGGGKGGGKPAK